MGLTGIVGLVGTVYLLGLAYVVWRVAPTLKRWAGGDQ